MSDFVKVARLSELPPGRVKPLRVEDEDVALYNVGGRVYATRDVCPHQNFPLSKGELRGAVIKCDLHQWQFDVTTGANVLNPCNYVRCWETKVEGDDVFVRLVPLPPPVPPPEPFVSREDA